MVIVQDLVVFMLNVSPAQRGPLLASDLHVANGSSLPFGLMRNAGGNSKVEGPADYSLVLVEYIPISSAAPEGCYGRGL